MKFAALPEQLQSLLLKVTGLHSKDQDLLPSKLRQWHYSEIFWELYGKHSRNDMGQDDTAKTATELIHLLNQYIVANRSAIFSLNIRNPILIKRPKPPLREQYACEFRGRPASHFGIIRPVVSASSGHPFRCDPVSRFGVIRPSFSFFVSGAAA